MTAPPPTREYVIQSEPRGRALEGLLNYCAAIGGSCTLVDQFAQSRKAREAREHFLSRAKSYMLGMEDVRAWPGTSGVKKAVSLWRFTLCAGLIDILIAQAEGLYDFRAPKLPEDLAVYRNDGSVLLGSVAHEHMGWMNLTFDERADRRLGLVELRPDAR